MNTPENAAFKTILKNEPDIFHLSGWQTGMVLNEILAMPADVQCSGVQIVKQLDNITLQSPSSEMRLDSGTNFFIADTVYKCILAAGESALAVIPEAAIKERWTNMVQSRVDGPESGWTNTYLCY